MTRPRNMLRTIMLLGCALASAATPASRSAAATRAGTVSTEHVQSVPLPLAETVSIERTWGDIRIEGSDGAAVSVRVTARSKAAIPPADADAARHDLDGFAARIVAASPSRVVITALSPGAAGLKRFGGRRGVALTYTITMPRTAGLELRHGVGSVEVAGLASDVNVAADVGDVRITTPLDPTVAVAASATIGDVSVARHARTGTYRRHALLGGRYSDEPAGAARHVIARVKIGSIEID